MTVEREINVESYEFVEKSNEADLKQSRLTMHQPLKHKISGVFNWFLTKAKDKFWKQKNLNDEKSGPKQEIFSIER